MFDNSTDSKIRVLDVPFEMGSLKLYLMEMGNIFTPNEHSWIVAEVTGRWTGTLYEREIISDNIRDMFIFLGRYRLILKKGSRLADVMKKYAVEGKLFAISELAAKLNEMFDGHIREELARDWPLSPKIRFQRIKEIKPMKSEKLSEIINGGEGLTVEFKKAEPN
ncbi:hypothetical protein [Acetobacterium paludosum]|uniref:hypothetical protein n=1 Tax=Acetobacterium paludosum TaxID=52693 RepID=UPI001FAABCD9|nr:hypothetical protein [Acetobacterium paludosum]